MQGGAVRSPLATVIATKHEHLSPPVVQDDAYRRQSGKKGNAPCTGRICADNLEHPLQLADGDYTWNSRIRTPNTTGAVCSYSKPKSPKRDRPCGLGKSLVVKQVTMSPTAKPHARPPQAWPSPWRIAL